MRTRSIEIRDTILRAQKTATTLCEADLDLFRQWEPELHVDDQKKLVLEGADELLYMAERMQNRFPKLLRDNFTNNTYRVWNVIFFNENENQNNAKTSSNLQTPNGQKKAI